MIRSLFVLSVLAAIGQAAPPQVAIEKDVVYGKGGDEELRLGLARLA